MHRRLRWRTSLSIDQRLQLSILLLEPFTQHCDLQRQAAEQFHQVAELICPLHGTHLMMDLGTRADCSCM